MQYGLTLEVRPTSGEAREMTIEAIVYDAEEGGYWAEVPSIPGCRTQGETLDELKDNLRDVIEACLSVEMVKAQTIGGTVLELVV